MVVAALHELYYAQRLPAIDFQLLTAANTLDEVIERFGGGSEEREAQAQSLRWLVPMCRAAGIVRLVLNGSFATSAPMPNDVDCVLLPGLDYVADSEAAFALRAGLPYLSLQIAENLEDWQVLTGIIFASDRNLVPKGMIEVRL